MVSADESRRVLEVLLAAYPDDGVILGVRMWPGWGNTLQVEVNTKHDAQAGRAVGIRAAAQIREAILQELAPSRPMVTITPLDLGLGSFQGRGTW
jgi:hypothetical protein